MSKARREKHKANRAAKRERERLEIAIDIPAENVDEFVSGLPAGFDVVSREDAPDDSGDYVKLTERGKAEAEREKGTE